MTSSREPEKSEKTDLKREEALYLVHPQGGGFGWFFGLVVWGGGVFFLFFSLVFFLGFGGVSSQFAFPPRRNAEEDACIHDAVECSPVFSADWVYSPYVSPFVEED